MPGLGTIVNAAAIILGGLAGLLFGKLMKTRVQETIITSCGVCVMFFGIGGAMEKMLTSSGDGTISSGSTMMLIASVVLGGLVGSLLNIEGGMERFGIWLRKVTHSEGDGGFVDGFVTASLTVCIFSAIPVAVFQGTITALSKLLEPVMTPAALNNLSLVGSVLIFCVGVNLVWGKKIRVADLLPSLVFAVVCAFLPWF